MLNITSQMQNLYYNLIGVSYMHVGNVLRDLRLKRNLTQNQLGLYAGISGSYISQLESGKRPKPSGEVLAKLAAKLGVTVDYILHRAEGAAANNEETERIVALYRILTPVHRYVIEAVAQSLYQTQLQEKTK
jgi:transcriptional regulator with XRE-family HTH domain